MSKVEKRKGNVAFKAQLDALLDAAVDAIILIGRDARITHFNPAAERLFGYRSAEVIGQNVKCLMPEPYRAEHDSYVGRYLKTGEARIIGIGREVTGQRKDGSTFPIELSVGEVKQDKERGFVGIIRDITQRKLYEEQLRRQEEELRLVFESAPTAIVTVSADGRLLNANRAWLELMDYSEQEMPGLSCRDIVHPDDWPAFEEGITRLRDGQRNVWRSELRLTTRAGEIMYVHLQAGIIRNPGGAQFVILELVDQTARAHAEREAMILRENLAHITRLNTMGEMATGIAHELNQPLTAIATYAQVSRRLLASGLAEPPEVMEVLEKIGAQAVRAGEIIRRLRAMLVKRDSQREDADCSAMIRDIVRLAEMDLTNPSLTIQLEITQQLPRVSVDRVQIQQVILNLLRNAMEAMAESATGSEITISASQADGHTVEICVSDRGPGVNKEAAARLFDAFYTTKAQGLGMGLAICRSIAESHGGALTFMNNRYGGATFVLQLPVQQESPQA